MEFYFMKQGKVIQSYYDALAESCVSQKLLIKNILNKSTYLDFIKVLRHHRFIKLFV